MSNWSPNAFTLAESYSLMPCQLCGHSAHMLDNTDDESDTLREYEQAGCPACRAHGPVAYWDPAPRDPRGNITCSGREFIEFLTRQNVKHRPRAAKLWNEMQAFVARGKLLDEPAPARKGGRL